jgi:hypothetical protein
MRLCCNVSNADISYSTQTRKFDFFQIVMCGPREWSNVEALIFRDHGIADGNWNGILNFPIFFFLIIFFPIFSWPFLYHQSWCSQSLMLKGMSSVHTFSQVRADLENVLYLEIVPLLIKMDFPKSFGNRYVSTLTCTHYWHLYVLLHMFNKT